MKVYLNEFIHPEAVAYLKKHVTVVDTFQKIEELDGILVRGIKITRDIVEHAKNLKVVGRHGVGYEGVDLEACREYGVHVVNAPRANAVSVAELVVARFLEMSRHLYASNAKLRKGEFTRIAPPDMLGTEVTGKTLGLIGMGNIPRIVADIMRAAFHVEVLGFDPFISAETALSYGIRKVDTLEELLEQSDLVSINVHLTKETENMISGKLFDHFRPNAIFVNTARGHVVNEDDLYDALVSGKLKAAAFDVFAQEPLPRDSKLLTLENFSATPHIGGNTEEALYRTGMTVVKNILAVLEGQEPEGMVI